MKKQFVTWLVRLEKRVENIQENIHHMSKGMLSRELNVCNSFLSNLQTYALLEEIDLDEYYDRVSAIHDVLVEIQEEIERKPWWVKLLNMVRNTVAIVFDLLGFPSISNLLRPPDDIPPLLLR